MVAEKEALQAVAKQLSAERDEATAEVNALKVAVHSMTERMKSIEAMLEREVKELHTQNAALELLAGSLAIERDEAVVKVREIASWRIVYVTLYVCVCVCVYVCMYVCVCLYACDRVYDEVYERVLGIVFYVRFVCV